MGTTIGVLGGFSVEVDGAHVSGLSIGSQRLLVFLALHDRTVSRAAVATTLWPHASAAQAGVTLRSALARLDSVTRGAIRAEAGNFTLVTQVRVDFREAQALAHRLLDPDDAGMVDGNRAASAIATLSRELLPDWYDDWIISVGEEWRHLRAAGLEALATRLLASGRHGEAAGAARAAISVDPLRETPHGILIRIHLADGNQSNALGVYESYRTTLRIALGLEPTAHLSGLLSHVVRIGNDSARS
ncbi:MAG TPA: BTAD domain-containing putative transcriptional regulator [Pseudolysinimonas sp.]|nr:BTAD domain-containing putative transcriptional regulator [Pseudolysinimonas sp.]